MPHDKKAKNAGGYPEGKPASEATPEFKAAKTPKESTKSSSTNKITK